MKNLVLNDILLFFQNFNKKYKNNLDFNIILQADEEDSKLVN